MDYEKKYKEALDWMQSLYDGLHGATKEDAERYFPELKESEDERIRKAILELVRQSSEILEKKNQEQMIAWLEKQGELQLYKGNADTMRKNLIKAFKSVCGNYWGGLDVKDILYFLESKDAIELEKQGKQKSNDKVEPKFKVGDWVSYNSDDLQSSMLILDMDDKQYEVVNQNGDTGCLRIELLDEYFHLWTIEDAKDGDVIKEDSCIFIVKKMNTNGTVIFHCCLFADGEFNSIGSTLGFDVDSTNPATKEQRDLLFQKMKEAGYEWNVEKKELRKIDNYCKENCKGFQETGKCFADGMCKAKKDAEQNSAWSEEDERMIEHICYALPKMAMGNIEILPSIAEEYAERLKSLKNRVQPHWKPTEEQLQTLKETVNYDAKCTRVDVLESLINDLKKL